MSLQAIIKYYEYDVLLGDLVAPVSNARGAGSAPAGGP